jgi:anti-sigma B factor antagonist
VAEMNLLVESRESGGWTIVEPKGEIDLYTAPRLKDQLSALAEQGRPQIVVDLQGVEFLDSTGLGVLIGSLRRCREREGDLVLAGARDTVEKVLRVTGLDKVFTIHPTADDVTT